MKKILLIGMIFALMVTMVSADQILIGDQTQCDPVTNPCGVYDGYTSQVGDLVMQAVNMSEDYDLKSVDIYFIQQSLSPPYDGDAQIKIAFTPNGTALATSDTFNPADDLTFAGFNNFPITYTFVAGIEYFIIVQPIDTIKVGVLLIDSNSTSSDDYQCYYGTNIDDIYACEGEDAYPLTDTWDMVMRLNDCDPDWYCSDLQSECPSNKVKECYGVTDANACGGAFTGNLADYNGACGYVSVYETSDMTGMVASAGGNAGLEVIAMMGIIVTVGVLGFLVSRFKGVRK